MPDIIPMKFGSPLHPANAGRVVDLRAYRATRVELPCDCEPYDEAEPTTTPIVPIPLLFALVFVSAAMVLGVVAAIWLSGMML